MKRRLLVIGNGMCSLRLLEELTVVAAGKFEITVIGAEPSPAYNRVLLSPMLAGELATGDVALKPASWYAQNGITLVHGATGHQRSKPRIVSPFCATAPAYLSTSAFWPPGPSLYAFHCRAAILKAWSRFGRCRTPTSSSRQQKRKSSAVVIGGGLLGIEAAYGLVRAGASVTLVHLVDRLMERQLDAAAAGLLERALEAKDIRVLLGTTTRRILGEHCVRAVELDDGRRIDCNLLVMAVGVRPSVALAKDAGLKTGRGILVDDTLSTSVEDIYALGECAEHRGQCYGLIEPAYEQAKALAHHLAGLSSSYQGSLSAASLKVSGIPVFSIGTFESEDTEAILLEDHEAAVYRKLVVRDGRLVGAVLFGDTSDSLWYRDLIRQQAPVDAIRSALAFGRAYAEAA